MAFKITFKVTTQKDILGVDLSFLASNMFNFLLQHNMKIDSPQ